MSLVDDLKTIVCDAFDQLVAAVEEPKESCENWTSSEQQERAIAILDTMVTIFGAETVEVTIRESYGERESDYQEIRDKVNGTTALFEPENVAPWEEDTDSGQQPNRSL